MVLSPPPPVLCLSTTGTSTPGNEAPPALRQGHGQARVSAPSRPRQQTAISQAAIWSSGTSWRRKASTSQRTSPAAWLPPPRLCAIRSTARSTWPSGPALVLGPASGAFPPLRPFRPFRPFRLFDRDQAHQVGARDQPGQAVAPQTTRVEAVLGEPFGDVLQGRVFGDGVVAELLGHDLARGAGDHRRVSASSSRRRRMVSMGMAIPNRLR